MTIGGLKNSTSPLALIAAAGFLMGGMALTPATAADLGGDCCADLEERVSELEATTVRKGNRKVSLRISGFVNRSFGWYEDNTGANEFYATGRGGSYGSRIKFDGSAQLTPNWKAGYVIRLRMDGDRGLRATAGSNPAGNRPGGGNEAVNRDLNFVYLKNKRLGTFVTGHVYAPTKQITDISLGGHNVIGAEGNGWHGNAVNGFEVEQNGAHQAVAWISPTFRGFTYSVAWVDLDYRANRRVAVDLNGDGDTTDAGESAVAGDDTDSGTDAFDMALRYANEFGPIRIAGGIGYTVTDSDDDVEFSNVMGSLALMHTPTGLNIAGSGGKADNSVTAGGFNNNDRSFWRIEGGINRDFTGLGNTSIYGEYAQYNYDPTAGTGNLDEVDMWGIGIVQHFDSAATELYLAYRSWEGENEDNTDAGTVNQLMAGMRIKF